MVNQHSADVLVAEELLYFGRNEYEKARQALSAEISLCERTLGQNHNQLISLLRKLSKIERSQQHYSQAENLLSRAISIGERNCGSDHPEVAVILYDLSDLYFGQRRFGEAEWLLRRVLACLEQALGKNHALLARVLNNLAYVCDKRSKRDEAELYCRRAFALVHAQAENEAPGFASAPYQAKGLPHVNNRYKDTELIFRQAFAASENIVAVKSPEPSAGPNKESEPGRLVEQPTHDDALSIQVMEVFENLLDPQNPDMSVHLDNFALIWNAD